MRRLTFRTVHKPHQCYIAPHRVDAVYRDSVDESNSLSPLLAALPAVREPDEWIDMLLHCPAVPADWKKRSARDRALLTASLLEQAFYPLGRILELASAIDCLLRRGYERLPPNDLQFNRDASERLTAHRERRPTEINEKRRDRPRSLGGFLIADSGFGKSRSVAQILQTYSRVICHRFAEHFGATFEQVTHLYVLVPGDASLKALCVRFIKQLDDTLGTAYAAKERVGIRSAGYLEELMAELAMNHALGLLVLDDVHHLMPRSSGGHVALKNALAQFTDKLGIPILLCGIAQTEAFLESEEYLRRRFSGYPLRWTGISAIPPVLTAEERSRMKKVPKSDWEHYSAFVWDFKMTLKDQVLSDSIKARWHTISKGSIHNANDLFLRSVSNGLLTGSERVGPPLVVSDKSDAAER